MVQACTRRLCLSACSNHCCATGRADLEHVLCHRDALSNEDGFDPASGHTRQFKANEVWHQKSCEIVSISQAVVCPSAPAFLENKFTSQLAFKNIYMLIWVEIDGAAQVAHGPKITLVINNSDITLSFPVGAEDRCHGVQAGLRRHRQQQNVLYYSDWWMRRRTD